MHIISLAPRLSPPCMGPGKTWERGCHSKSLGTQTTKCSLRTRPITRATPHSLHRTDAAYTLQPWMMASQNSPAKNEDAKVRSEPPLPTVDLSKPRYDQSTYQGRLKHFMETTNPLNVFASNKQLDEAATLVNLYKRGECPPGTTEERLWRAKRLYDSAFHPETGEKLFLPGRMSFQVPGNMFILGMMLTFRTNPFAVTFWQWFNQAFMATVNYTNKGGNDVTKWNSPKVLGPFGAATIAAAGTAVGLNKVLAKHVTPSSLPARLVPLAAVAAGNMINVPLMRYKELQEGSRLMDESGSELGYSKRAARKAIAQTVFIRISIATPIILFPAVMMEQLEKRVKMRATWMKPTLTAGFTGLSLIFAVPVCLAIFPQQSSMPTSSLEPGVREAILSTHPDIKTVYFNKGL